jgi:hypothetical protein
VLETLLGTAIVSGLITDGAAGALAISMRQQLQQAGVLQQLATVMAALAADLHSEAAALAGQSEDELCAHFSRPSVANINEPHRQAPLLDLIRRLLQALMMLWSSPDQTVSVKCHSWLCDPSGHAEAAMQLSTAALQHGSSVLQHVLPAVQQEMPQHAAALLQELQGRTTAALALSESLAVLLSDAQQHTTAVQGAQVQQRAQQLCCWNCRGEPQPPWLSVNPWLFCCLMLNSTRQPSKVRRYSSGRSSCSGCCCPLPACHSQQRCWR